MERQAVGDIEQLQDASLPGGTQGDLGVGIQSYVEAT